MVWDPSEHTDDENREHVDKRMGLRPVLSDSQWDFVVEHGHYHEYRNGGEFRKLASDVGSVRKLSRELGRQGNRERRPAAQQRVPVPPVPRKSTPGYDLEVLVNVYVDRDFAQAPRSPTGIPRLLDWGSTSHAIDVIVLPSYPSDEIRRKIGRKPHSTRSGSVKIKASIETWQRLSMRWNPDPEGVLGLQKVEMHVSPHVTPKELADEFKRLQRRIGITRRRAMARLVTWLIVFWVSAGWTGTDDELKKARSKLKTFGPRARGLKYLDHRRMLRKKVEETEQRVLAPKWSTETIEFNSGVTRLGPSKHGSG